MRWALDHIVFVTNDLPAEIDRYRTAGFNVVPGGRHANTGAVNALISLADQSYLELFSFADPKRAPRTHSNWAAFESGGGLVSYWVRTPDIGSDIENLRQIGFAIENPRSGSRIREDGFEVKFLLAVPALARDPHLPALIQDVTAHSQRVPSFVQHANGASRIKDICISVSDLEPARLLSKIVGAPLESSGQQSNSIGFKLGNSSIRFSGVTTEQSRGESNFQGLVSVLLEGTRGAHRFPI